MSQTKRCLQMVELLFYRVLEGMSNKELAAALNVNPAHVTRDMQELIEAGWVQRLDSGRYGLTSRPASLATAYDMYMEKLNNRTKEFRNSVNKRALDMLP